jgi:hypothetical protein
MYGNDEKSFPAFPEYIQVVGTGRSLKDRKGDQRGWMNRSQSKFLEGTWPIS